MDDRRFRTKKSSLSCRLSDFPRLPCRAQYFICMPLSPSKMLSTVVNLRRNQLLLFAVVVMVLSLYVFSRPYSRSGSRSREGVKSQSSLGKKGYGGRSSTSGRRQSTVLDVSDINKKDWPVEKPLKPVERPAEKPAEKPKEKPVAPAEKVKEVPPTPAKEQPKPTEKPTAKPESSQEKTEGKDKSAGDEKNA